LGTSTYQSQGTPRKPKLGRGYKGCHRHRIDACVDERNTVNGNVESTRCTEQCMDDAVM
jgi:hypothetical protein